MYHAERNTIYFQAAAYSDATDTTVRNMDVALFTAMDKIHVKFGPQLFK